MHDTHENENFPFHPHPRLSVFAWLKVSPFSHVDLWCSEALLCNFYSFQIHGKWKRTDCAKKSQTHLLRVMEYSSSFHSISVCFCFTNVKQTHYIWYRWGMSSGGISLCLVIKMHSCLKTDIAVLERHPCWRAHCLPLFLSLPQLFV